MRLACMCACCVVLGACASGCITHSSYVSTYQIHRQLPELRSSGHAEVNGHGLDLDSEVEFRGRTTRVADLVAGRVLVPPVGAARHRLRHECRLLRARRVGLGDRVDWGKSIGLYDGAAVAVALVGTALGLRISLDRHDSHCDIDCP